MNKNIDILNHDNNYANRNHLLYRENHCKIFLKIRDDNNKKTYRSAEREQGHYYLGNIFLLP